MSESDTRVLEIEIAADCDHSTHENTVTVFVVGSLNDLEHAFEKAGRIVADRQPGLINREATASFSGSEPLDDAKWRQFIDETQDDVFIGPNVPV